MRIRGIESAAVLPSEAECADCDSTNRLIRGIFAASTAGVIRAPVAVNDQPGFRFSGILLSRSVQSCAMSQLTTAGVRWRALIPVLRRTIHATVLVGACGDGDELGFVNAPQGTGASTTGGRAMTSGGRGGAGKSLDGGTAGDSTR